MGLVLSVGFYAAFLFFTAGYLVRMLGWARYAPQQALPGGIISLCTCLGALADIVLFRRLLRLNDVLWAGEWIFHASLLVLFLGHLKYILDPVPAFIASMEIPARIAAWLLPASLLYIGIMKVVIEKKAYVSSYNFMLLGLIAASGISGLVMKYSLRADLVNVKHFTMGLVTLHPAALPVSPVFTVHVLLFLVLFACLPTHVFAAPLTMLEARQRDEELRSLMHEK